MKANERIKYLEKENAELIDALDHFRSLVDKLEDEIMQEIVKRLGKKYPPYLCGK